MDLKKKQECNFRIGNGFDTHRLVEGRKLIIGGVEIPFGKGLDGHSDADVLIHAIIDSLCGALKLGDIGRWFPDTASEWKNADSQELLKTVFSKVKELGWLVVNLDSTVIMERPKLRDYIPEMERVIARILEVEEGVVNVKATTSEKLGFIGRGEGVSANSVVLLTKR